MSVLRTSVGAALALSASLACAQGSTLTIEQRLQQLEAEQAAMKQQLAERDKLIQDLRRELQGQQGQAAAAAQVTDTPTRNHRLNVQLLDVNKSPVSSTFGYYTGGQDGWTLASSFSIFF